MNENKALINLSGAMDLIKMSKKPLAPIYEAINNSLEALNKKSEDTNRAPLIGVALYFGGLLDESKELEKVEITDNGIGFDDENYMRFKEFFDKSKGYGNKGTGRFQYFHRFYQIKIDSVFEENGTRYRRTFSCTKNNFIPDEKKVEDKDSRFQTKVSLCGYLGKGSEKIYFDTLKVEQLVSEIKSHFMLRFYLDNKKDELYAPKVKISFIKGGNVLEEKVIDPENLPAPEKEGEIFVPYMKVVDPKIKPVELDIVAGKKEKIKWAHFVVPDSELEQNGVFLCSKDIPVQALKFDQLKKNEQIDGKRYLTAFYGDVLDKPMNVSDSVDSFVFPERRDVENLVDDMYFDPTEEFLFIDTIKEKISKAMPSIYKDILNIQEEHSRDVASIAKAHGISEDIVKSTNVNISDDEETITKKLYVTQSKQLAEKSYKAKKLIESLSQLDPASTDYQSSIQKKTEELSELVDEQNKEELSRYVIRREMVTNILKKILDEELEYKNKPIEKGKNKHREALVHDLIFKRKSESTRTLNDLWILNEEFMHFDGCSDLPLNKIKTFEGEKLLQNVSDETIQALGLKLTKKPDIFLHASEEKCLIIELKEPNVDLSDHLNQMTKYCTLIANFGSTKITRFYCYLIGENINPIDLDGDYKETVNGDWIRPHIDIVSRDIDRNNIATAQIEVIKLSSIHFRAHRRNLSFAEKLGLPHLLE